MDLKIVKISENQIDLFLSILKEIANHPLDIIENVSGKNECNR